MAFSICIWRYCYFTEASKSLFGVCCCFLKQFNSPIAKYPSPCRIKRGRCLLPVPSLPRQRCRSVGLSKRLLIANFGTGAHPSLIRGLWHPPRWPALPGSSPARAAAPLTPARPPATGAALGPWSVPGPPPPPPRAAPGAGPGLPPPGQPASDRALPASPAGRRRCSASRSRLGPACQPGSARRIPSGSERGEGWLAQPGLGRSRRCPQRRETGLTASG